MEQRFGLNTLIHRIGAVDENPNEDKEAIKNGARPINNETDAKYYLKQWRYIPNRPENWDSVKRAILEFGSVGISYYADKYIL